MPVKKTTNGSKRTQGSPELTKTTQGSPELTHEEIARRAYEKFLARGRQPGREMQDWLDAERELRSGASKPLPLKPSAR
jgi:hypothetical protein